MKESGYRLNVGLVIANKKGHLLLCKRTGMNSWQFPQGGIDYAEEPLKAAKRELYEEVGIKSNLVTAFIIGVTISNKLSIAISPYFDHVLGSPIWSSLNIPKVSSPGGIHLFSSKVILTFLCNFK